MVSASMRVMAPWYQLREAERECHKKEEEESGKRVHYIPLTLEGNGHIDEIDCGDIASLAQIHVELLVAAQAAQIEAAKLFAHLPRLVEIQCKILAKECSVYVCGRECYIFKEFTINLKAKMSLRLLVITA